MRCASITVLLFAVVRSSRRKASWLRHLSGGYSYRAIAWIIACSVSSGRTRIFPPLSLQPDPGLHLAQLLACGSTALESNVACRITLYNFPNSFAQPA